MEPLKPKPKYYNIQVAAELSGLTTHTIRAWEKRYQALTPTRSESGRRLYSDIEVDRLSLLSQLTQLGSSIGQIANLPDSDLKDIYLKLTQSTSPTAQAHTDFSEAEINQRIDLLFSALKSYDMGKIVNTLEEIQAQITPREMALKVLAPMFAAATDTINLSEAEGHALKAVLKFHAGNMIYHYLGRKNKSQTKIAITGLEGDYRAATLLLSALLCCHHRLHFYYLNANLPIFSIIEASKAIEAGIIILTLVPSQTKQPHFEESIHQIMSQLSQKIKVVLVGVNLEGHTILERWKNLSALKDLEALDAYLERIV